MTDMLEVMAGTDQLEGSTAKVQGRGERLVKTNQMTGVSQYLPGRSLTYSVSLSGQ